MVAIVEHLSYVQPMLRAGQHLAKPANADLHLILAGGSSDEMAWMEGQVRLLLGEDIAPDLILVPQTHASPEALMSFAAELAPGFIIAKLNGPSLPPGDGLLDFARNPAGPIFLVR